MPEISYFHDITHTENAMSLPLDSYLEQVRNGYWQDIIIPLRAIKDKKTRNEAKKLIPGVTFSGVFSKRRDDSLVVHSGFICIDLDELENLNAVFEMMCKDKYVYSCFQSTSGTGLRVLFRIYQNKHKESFLGLAAYLLRMYGQVADSTCQNPSRQFAVTYDPDLYMAINMPPIFTEYVKEVFVKKVANFAYANDDFEYIIKQITQRNLNICEGYSEWLKVGFALADKFGAAGEHYFHLVSQNSEKYNYANCSKQFKYCLRSKNKDTATISTFYYFAKNAGIQIISERTTKIRKATISGKSTGLTKDKIIEKLKTEGIDNSEETVTSIFDSYSETNDSDGIVEQLELYLKGNYNLRRNVITRYIERDGNPLDKSQMNSIYIAAKKIIPSLHFDLVDRLILSDFIESYNPLEEYFEKLGGKRKIPILGVDERENSDFESPIINLLAQTIKNNNEAYTVFFLRKWIVSIVSAAYYIHSPLMLVLQGGQSTGKTEWFRRLLPRKLMHPYKYYSESKLIAGKDDDILMTQKLLIMDDELSGKTRTEDRRLKELSSKETFSLREPYGRNNIDLPRLAVMCGTTNFKNILTDTSGNRRIIPVDVDSIDRALYNSIDKDELFKEAYELLCDGFDWRVTSKADINFLNINSSEYEIPVVENELILKYFKKPSDSSTTLWLTGTDIKVELERITQQRLSINVVGRQLSKAGFTKKGVRVNGEPLQCWGVERTSANSNNSSSKENPF